MTFLTVIADCRQTSSSAKYHPHKPARNFYRMNSLRNKSQCRYWRKISTSLFLSGWLLMAITVEASSSSTLDLSYLYRTQSKLVSQAIQEALQIQEDLQEVDVSASLVDKDVEDLLILFRQVDVLPQRTFGVVAQKNQWTHKEATLLLETIVGPESDEPKTVIQTKMKKKRTRKSHGNEHTTAKNDSVNVHATTQDQNSTSLDSESEGLHDGANFTNSSKEVTSTTTIDGEEEAQITTSNKTASEGPPRLVSQAITRVDLGWNDLGLSADSRSNTVKAWHTILQRTIRNRERCPKELRFPVCGLGPAACRAIGKGLMARYENIKEGSSDLPDSISLQLVGNHAIGDPGVAALSAAIRTVATKHKGCTVLHTLDLSGCGITDTGAEALAIALQDSPYCVRHLDLSNNLISNEGAAALGRALAMGDDSQASKIESLDLSNNKGIEDAGAKALALAIEKGSIDNLIMRSCHVHADGAAAMVKSLRVLALSEHRPAKIQLDLSGNPLGILRKKAKTGGGKYSVSALTSKATATTAAYMNLIGKTVQKSLKDLGIAESLDTLESDDEEEAQMNEKFDEDPSKIKCGALSMADALLLDNNDDDENPSVSASKEVFRVSLGLRHCAFDTRASEALAAIRHRLQSSPALMDINIDVQMNNILEEDAVAALRGEKKFEARLSDMAECYLEAMEALRVSRHRAGEAAKVARQRMRAEQDLDDRWGGDVKMDEDYGYPDEYDEDQARHSDTDYDQDEDEENFF